MKFLSLLLLCSGSYMAGQAPRCPPPVAHISISASTYSPEPGVSFQLRHFSATLLPLGTTAPTCYAKQVNVSRGEIFVSSDSLTKVFNTRLEAGESKIKDLLVVTSAEGLTISGNTTKLIPIHFSISGPVSTDGDTVKLQAEKFKAEGIPLKALLELVGKHLSSVLSLKNLPGVTVKEDTMLFLPEQLAHIKGTISAVITSEQGVTLRYAAPSSTRHFHASDR